MPPESPSAIWTSAPGQATVDCAGDTPYIPDGHTYVFVDQYNDEYSRDLETGAGYGDAYYKQHRREVLGRKQSNTTIIK